MDITINCTLCWQQLTVPIMPGQPPTPVADKCVLHQMWRDGRWALSETAPLFAGCVLDQGGPRTLRVGIARERSRETQAGVSLKPRNYHTSI